MYVYIHVLVHVAEFYFEWYGTIWFIQNSMVVPFGYALQTIKQ